MKIEMKYLKQAERGYLLGTLEINGASHHAEFIRVEDVNFLQCVLSDDDPDNYDRYETMQEAYSGHYATMKIDGHEGDWVCHVVPYDE